MGKVRLLFERQGWHYSLLLVLLGAVLAAGHAGRFFTGSFQGISTATWFYIAVAIPIFHQVYVWLIWRTQLHFSFLTRLFGQRGFIYYSIIFLILFVSRLAFIIVLAWSNKNSLHFNQPVLSGLAMVILIPSVYLLYSIARYFGFKRALGIDHFDLSYRHKALVKDGIFRFTDNAMYVFGLLLILQFYQDRYPLTSFPYACARVLPDVTNRVLPFLL